MMLAYLVHSWLVLSELGTCWPQGDDYRTMIIYSFKTYLEYPIIHIYIYIYTLYI